jgi:hypothetical protein
MFVQINRPSGFHLLNFGITRIVIQLWVSHHLWSYMDICLDILGFRMIMWFQWRIW